MITAAGLPAAIIYIGIHTKYNFCVPLPGAKVGIEKDKRKKPE